MKFSVFRTVFDVKFWWNFPSHTQTLENVARKISPKFHPKLHDTFGREKRRNISLPHFCRVAALIIVSRGLGVFDCQGFATVLLTACILLVGSLHLPDP